MLTRWSLSWDYSFCTQDACPKADTCMRQIGWKLAPGTDRGEYRQYLSVFRPEETPCEMYWDSAPFEAEQAGRGQAKVYLPTVKTSRVYIGRDSKNIKGVNPMTTPAEKAAETIYNYIGDQSCVYDGQVKEERIAELIQAAIDESLPKWEGIESCPRDGTHVLLWNVEHEEVHSMFFAGYLGVFRGVTDDAPWGRDEDYTHWMPRPQPPEDAR